MKELEDFLNREGPKYLVLLETIHKADQLMYERWPSPGSFIVNGSLYVALNLEPSTIPEVISYIESTGLNTELEFTDIAGCVYLLSHAQVLNLVNTTEPI